MKFIMLVLLCQYSEFVVSSLLSFRSNWHAIYISIQEWCVLLTLYGRDGMKHIFACIIRFIEQFALLLHYFTSGNFPYTRFKNHGSKFDYQYNGGWYGYHLAYRHAWLRRNHKADARSKWFPYLRRMAKSSKAFFNQSTCLVDTSHVFRKLPKL